MSTIHPPEQRVPNLSLGLEQPAPRVRDQQRIVRRLRQALLVVGLSLLLSIAATWPLAQQLTTALPLGTEREATVPIFNLWTLWWNADRLSHGYAGYWDAPIFFPNRDTFTFSEPQPLTGLLMAPLWALGLPPALIYNLALLLLLTLNGVFAYRLARALRLPAAASLAAALLMVTLPFVAKIAGVLQLTALFGMLWTLEGLIAFGRAGETRWAIWAAAGFVATYLTCQQYALMFALFALAAALLALAQLRFGQAAVLRLGLAGLASLLIVLALAWPSLRVQRALGLSRPEQIVQALSARPIDLLTRPDNALAPLPPPGSADTGGLFPGGLLLTLALAGLLLGLRDAPRRSWTVFLGASALAALLLALGLNLELLGWRPFATLRAIIPGYDGLRSPFRFAALMQLCLPLLAAVALAQLPRRLARGGVPLLLVLTLLAAAENLSANSALTSVPTPPRSAWSAWLRAQPAGTVIAHVPFPEGVYVDQYEIETRRMFAQIDHRQPMVNGYSGYFPQTRTPQGQIIPSYTQFQLAMAQQFPDYPLLCVLGRSLGVQLIVVDQPWLASHQAAIAAQGALLQPVYADRDVQIYALQLPQSECQSR